MGLPYTINGTPAVTPNVLAGVPPLTTSDATPATLAVLSVPTGQGLALDAVVTARTSDGSQIGRWRVTAHARNPAGTAALAGDGTPGSGDNPEVAPLGVDDPTWSGPSVDASAGTLRLRVTGKAATTLTWACVGTTLVY